MGQSRYKRALQETRLEAAGTMSRALIVMHRCLREMENRHPQIRGDKALGAGAVGSRSAPTISIPRGR